MRTPVPTPWLLAALTLVYFAAGKLGLSFATLHSSASAVLPPTGIALAAFLLFGNRAWPAIFVGAFLVNVTTAGFDTHLVKPVHPAALQKAMEDGESRDAERVRATARLGP